MREREERDEEMKRDEERERRTSGKREKIF